MAYFCPQVRSGDNEYVVCRVAFCSLFGISDKRLRRLTQHLAQNITSPVDKRGRHKKHFRISDEIREQIDAHIRSFPRRKSHYSRCDNIKRYYLSSDLSIKKMWLLYLQKFEPDQYLLVKGNKASKPLVKYDFYREYFLTHFNMTFGFPRSDTCAKCDALSTSISNETDTVVLQNLKMEHGLHLQKAETFRNFLKESKEKAKTSVTHTTISFDFQQNLPLPKLTVGAAFYSRQLWLHNMSIHCTSKKIGTMYVFTENDGAKCPNEVATCVDHYIRNYVDKNVETIDVFTDNCAAQNKNITLCKFFVSLIECGRFKEIRHIFPEPGHSYLPSDQDFAIIEKEARRHEVVYDTRGWIDIICKASHSFQVVHMTYQDFKDYHSHFQHYYRKVPRSANGSKFAISKYKELHYSHAFPGQVAVCAEMAMDETNYTKFNFKKQNHSCPDMSNIASLFSNSRPITEAKLKDIEKLKKFVPAVYHPFYNSLNSTSSGQENFASEESE